MPFERNKNWRFRCLITSDRHIDNPDSDWGLQVDHLDEARENDWPVLDAGDLLDVMQGRNDKRASKSSLRAELKSGAYLDLVVETTAEKLAPYADLFAVILSGNHEDAILERYETSLMDRLVERLKVETGATVYHGGYGASVNFAFLAKPRARAAVSLWMEHGAGGGGAATGNMLALFRKLAYLPDFDVIASGHTHDKINRPMARLRRSPLGRLYEEEVLLLALATYKREYKTGRGGWHVRTGKSPKPWGAWWLEFYWDAREERVGVRAVAA